MRDGAGILPVAFNGQNILFLFGQERETGEWSDFGGARDDGEQLIETAAREGYEETSGLLGTREQINQGIRSRCLTTIELDNYISYVFCPLATTAELLAAPFFFANNFDFTRQTNPQYLDEGRGFYEKSDIKWFTSMEAFNNRDTFRPFYRPVLGSLVTIEQTLIEEAKLIERG